MALELNEMAKAAAARVYDRLPDNRKAIYLTGKYFDKITNTQRPQLNRLKTYIEAHEMDWATYCNLMNDNGMMDISQRSPTSNIAGYRDEFNTQWGRLYSNMLHTIEVNKDDIDRNYIDKIYKYYNLVRKEHLLQDDAKEQAGITDEVIDWVNNNQEEVAERFGNHWEFMKRMLLRWTNPNQYNGSYEQLIDQFWDWKRAHDAADEGEGAALDNELAYRLGVLLAVPENDEKFGRFRNYVLVTVLETLGDHIPGILLRRLCTDAADHERFVEIYGRASTRIAEILRNNFGDETINNYVENPDSIETDDDTSVEDTENQEIPVTDMTDADDIRQYIVRSLGVTHEIDGTPREAVYNVINDVLTAAADVETIDSILDRSQIGRINKAQVKRMYNYAQRLNPRYHVGREGVFNVSLQDFYQINKEIFRCGFYDSTISDILKDVGALLQAQRHTLDDEYWTNEYQPNDVTDDDDFNEAVRVLIDSGYIVE